jgi:hypothetical protein
MDQPSTLSTPPNPPRSISPNFRVRAQRAKDLTRSQRIRCRTLRFDARWNIKSITEHLHFTRRQVETACQKATPTKRSGRPLTLSSTQVDEIIAWLKLSRRNRRMTHLEVATTIHPFCDWSDISGNIITHALALRGYGRHIALGKPGLSKATKIKRLKFAEEHKDWTIS